ncbi:type II secretion system F family protein [Thermogutta sp.]|jgi:tight adherence protein C|uniref:type II secretion system F family protein n=1 Tax=Thermogutta sp. TaxID=1962930 RepID=UPI0032209422
METWQAGQQHAFLLVISSALWAAAGFFVTQWLWQIVHTEDLPQGAEWRYDVSRINELRRADRFFRLFQPLIQLLARFNRAAFRDALPEIQRHIHCAGLPRFWLAEEYLAKLELIAVMLFPLYTYVAVRAVGAAGILLAVIFSGLTVWLLRLRLADRAARRLQAIKRRLPFLLDLLTLLMEAGSTFLNALAQAVEEYRGHPIAEEFGRVLADIRMGKTRYEAFNAMRDRLADDEITSIIGSILQGETLGTPLASIFRTQADVLRIKRSQRAEMIAGEAGVNMLLPGILVMAAAVLILVGPFLMNYLYFGLSL